MSRPDAPYNVVATPYNASAIVYWSPPPEGIIRQYTVFSIPGNKMMITPGTTITHIFGLTNGIPYQFQVVATDQYGESSDASVLSDPIVPILKLLPGPPRNLQSYTRPRSILLTWDSPLNNGGNNILYYTITLLDTDTGQTYVKYAIPGKNNYEYTWENLDNYTVYPFSITCTTSLGNSIQVFFPEKTPRPLPNPPTRVYIEPNCNLTLTTIYWTPSFLGPNDLPITEYVIEAEPPLPSPLRIDPSQTRWRITGLNPSVAYVFYMYAINEAGRSIDSLLTGPNQIFKAPREKRFVTGGNDPSISKKMRMSQLLRRYQYMNHSSIYVR